ncbi:hypothetical protein [Azospirillum sp. B21]|uniref:hypothetical protein n=1 Tax=Azospirillum sp. B21 TaxID=2607496 RepID=UPI00165F37C6|nr:hypothetical protein [Azospirillum sp. B21]
MIRKRARTGLDSAKDQAGHPTLMADQCRETVAMPASKDTSRRSFPVSSLGVRL